MKGIGNHNWDRVSLSFTSFQQSLEGNLSNVYFKTLHKRVSTPTLLSNKGALEVQILEMGRHQICKYMLNRGPDFYLKLSPPVSCRQDFISPCF